MLKFMRFDLLTIFPKIFDSWLQESIIMRALKKKILHVVVHDIRKFSKDKHRKVDDSPYGGGPGMVMIPQPLYDCIRHVQKLNRGPVIYLSPKGKMLTHNLAKKMAEKSVAKKQGFILLCGHYEGIDQRIIDLVIDFEISIGKYILTGGELAAMVFIDVLSRFVQGVLGDTVSSEEESFSKALNGKREYPHYTRPEVFKGLKVPEVLLSGNHAKIKKWRMEKVI